jgi:N-glycosylase/DNA lyase
MQGRATDQDAGIEQSPPGTDAAAYRTHLKDTYATMQKEICSRMDAFERLGNTGDERELLAELLFCILTPQATAHGCWDTIEELSACGLLESGTASEIAPRLHRARFKNKKAEYLVAARERFISLGLRETVNSFETEQDAREWFVKTTKGMGYKEASHFLRNIGRGSTLAILDRHILRSLVKAGALEREPASLTPQIYCDVEAKMLHLARELRIPMAHLDLVIWFDAKQEIFK